MKIFVNWNKPGSILKLEIPFKVGSPENIIAQVPGGSSTRPLDGAESPLQTWVRLKGFFSVAVCQKGAYAYDCNKNRLRVTLVRSSYYGYDQGTPLNFQLPQKHTDLGTHEFEFRIYTGGWQIPSTLPVIPLVKLHRQQPTDSDNWPSLWSIPIISD